MFALRFHYKGDSGCRPIMMNALMCRRLASSSSPRTMRAVCVSLPASPSSRLKVIHDAPLPQPSKGQALVQMHAAGVNFIDVYYRTGLYRSAKPLPSNQMVLGFEGSGTIVETDSSESNNQFKVGDRIVFYSPECSGAYAEFSSVPLSRAFVVPDWLDMDLAAALPVQAMTAHYLVTSTQPLSSGDIVVVHAAAGGTGRLLVAMAAARGARVIGTVSSAEKAQIAKQCGAWEVINYKEEPEFDQKVKELTKGEGVVCVYDSVGATTWRRSLSCLKPRGHLVLFGNASGAVPPVDPFLLMSSGSISMTRPNLAHYLLNKEEFDWRMTDILKFVQNGVIDVSISGKFVLEDSFKAHQMLENRQTTGKLLIKPF
eukprot:TRINITY_DN18500_c0_g1_i1.p1 TRINITY_DN18500_c0_g1~~TRINITY_DN18500_c0_g1_i1.p1  ORF type:complete len:371 (+),score=79.57 TRINITY_DN18500_c0_g1_i1:37-1149(+)